MIFEVLEKSFEFIVVNDTEFRGDMKDKGERNIPVCSVYKELKSGNIHRLRGLSLKSLPYPANKTLFIAHNVGAEAHTMLSCGIKLPEFWWDTMIEDKKLYFGKVRSHSLLNACKRYGIETISDILKFDFHHIHLAF